MTTLPLTLETGVKQLFLDDQRVAEAKNLDRVVHPLARRRMVLRPDQAWEGGRVGAFSAPIWVPEAGLYRWVYRPNYKDWVGLAVSEDGIHWEKPNLGLISYEGSQQNSLISKRRIIKVVHDPDDPDPQRRYKGLAVNTPVVSADLIHWQDAGAPDVPGGDSGSLTYDDMEGCLLAPVKIRDPDRETYRQFEIVTSDDFHTWSEPRFFFGPDDRDQEIAIERIRRWLSDPGRPRPLFVNPPPHAGWTPPKAIRDLPKRRHSWNAQCNNISVFPYHRQYVAMITFLYPTGAYRPVPVNTTGFFTVELASTRDLLSWNRLREPFLEPARLDHGVADNYERMLVQPVSQPVERNDELWFYYMGGKEHQSFTDSPHSPGRYSTYMDGTPRSPDSLSDVERADIAAGQSALYVGILRMDGFVSMNAGPTGGYLLTEPFVLPAGDLFLNAACSPSGHVSVELLAASGASLAVSAPVTGDAVRLPVHWRKRYDPAAEIGRPVRLRFTLENAELYAFWIEASPR